MSNIQRMDNNEQENKLISNEERTNTSELKYRPDQIDMRYQSSNPGDSYVNSTRRSNPSQEELSMIESIENMSCTSASEMNPMNNSTDLRTFFIGVLNNNTQGREFLLRVEDICMNIVLSKNIYFHYRFELLNDYDRMLSHLVAEFYGLRHVVHQIPTENSSLVIIEYKEGSRIPNFRFRDSLMLEEKEEESSEKKIILLKKSLGNRISDNFEAKKKSTTKSLALREQEYTIARNRIFGTQDELAANFSNTQEELDLYNKQCLFEPKYSDGIVPAFANIAQERSLAQNLMIPQMPQEYPYDFMPQVFGPYDPVQIPTNIYPCPVSYDLWNSSSINLNHINGHYTY